MPYRIALIVVALWAGALWMTGVSAYVLFDTLQDKQLAGAIAGKLFTVVSCIGMASGAFLIIHRMSVFGTSALKQGYFWAVLLMLLLVLAGHFGIQPLLAQLKKMCIRDSQMPLIKPKTVNVFKKCCMSWA